MRCKKTQDGILAEETVALAAEHLGRCPICQGFVRNWEEMQLGFHVLAAEPAPGPSWGFTARVLRRLQELPTPERAAGEFFERVGQRVVYAASVLAIVILMALALPSSGPVRGAIPTEIVPAQPDRSSYITAAFVLDESGDSQDANPLPVEPRGATN